MSLEELSCCGMRELDGVSNNAPIGLLQKMCGDLCDSYYSEENTKLNSNFAFIVFSDTFHRGKHSGRRFAGYIRRYKLGNVVESPIRVNPNTGHKLRVWTWAVDWKAMKKWWEKHRKED